MKLKNIIIQNFRSYKGRHIICVDNFTAFIGKNDSGKSTIFDALGVFFGLKNIKIDASDICVYAEKTGQLRIGCVFSDLPEEVVIDSTSVTSLKNEYLLNKDGDLEIHKVFEYNEKLLKKESIVAIANHPINKDIKNLLSLKNSDLKKIYENLKIISDTDKRSNVDLRRAIREKYTNIELNETEVCLDKESGKEIWDILSSKYLPEYFLFRADRPSTDEDAEVQDPLKVAIQQAIKEVQDEVDKVKDKIKERALDVALRTINKLSEFDKSLARELDPVFKSDPNFNNIFKLTLVGDNEIPINKRGSGVRRLILFSFFRAEAERLSEYGQKNNIIYAIEEPETAQHPDSQIRIVDTLKDISENDKSQVMITTHVPGLASNIMTSSIRYVSNDKNDQNKVKNVDSDLLIKISQELGVVPDRRIKVIVCVEGPHDIQFLKRINKIYIKENADFLDLSNDDRVIIIPLGGSTLKDWVNQHYLKSFGVPEVHIYDKDEIQKDGRYKYQEAQEEVNRRGDGSVAFLTNKREMENYLHEDAIKEVYKDIYKNPLNISVTDELDVESDIKSITGQEKFQRRKIKDWLNNEVAEKMTKELLIERNGYNEIKNWFITIQKLIK